ncbi:hypothetical protein ONZ43_g5532 [Nemania bipapillata]|uniref:Uncharacterized protein n=1 Tax=Nemania bipapillata TaxID=110536 RepID=A0ACC2I9P6_9PEZI|nr:hypothetical protein ONZ43_g5532 [Nemania bipapillata]
MVCVSEIYTLSDTVTNTPTNTPTNTTTDDTDTGTGIKHDDGVNLGTSNTTSTSPHTSTLQPLGLGDDDDGPNQCKEGDRRCSAMFNRVDRCNSNHDWVTYHDCRRSELCDETILECLPKTEFDPAPLTPKTPMQNGTVAISM